MHTPKFWHKPIGPTATVLRPLGALYAAATAQRVKTPGFDAACPVICVGNLNAGGTGKTPTTVALADRLSQRGRAVTILSRGYGGSDAGPIVVDAKSHTADQVGDEPLFMSAFAPVVVAKDRVAGAKLATKMGADVILMDDGFQSPALTKDLSIVVVDAARGFGNGLCIPAGPLREPVGAGLERADFVLSIGPAPTQAAFAKGYSFSTPHITADLEPLPTGMPWTGLRCFAFAGIGHPEKFFDSLRRAGVDLQGTQALSDHEPISPALFDRLRRQASAANAQLVTTEKDAARLSADLRPLVLPFPVRLAVSDWSPLDSAFDQLGL